MLSSLPTELIREILESTVPYTFHSTTYNERQRTLCSLSLVSKLFRSIAQPLLLEIVWIKSARDLVRFPLSRSGGGGGDSAGRPRCVIVEVAVEDMLRFRRNQTAVEDSLRMFSSVTSLTMSTYNTRTIDLALLSSFQSLSSLEISGYELDFVPSSPFTNLRSLSLWAVTNDLLIALLTPITLPKVRNLALFCSPTLQVLEQSAFVNLLPQLDSLTLDIARWKDSAADFLRSRATSLLIDCDTSQLVAVFDPQLRFHHIRLSDLSLGASDLMFLDLDNFITSLLETPSPPLRSIYLDSSLEPTRSLPSIARYIIRRLLAACQERKINVVFEPIPRKYGIDPYLSEEFCRRQQDSKRNGKTGSRAA